MLTRRYEIAILYSLAKDYYTGAGAIVDGGPLLGLTTNALANYSTTFPRSNSWRAFRIEVLRSSILTWS